MAMSTTEQTRHLFAFSSNAISKRKLEPEDSSLSLVQENGILVPRDEKRQRFNGESEVFPEMTENGLFSGQNTISDDQDDMEADSEMEDEAMTESSQEDNCDSKDINQEREKDLMTSSTSFMNLQRPRGFNCTAPRLKSYCFESGMLDNIIMSYHGI